MRTWHPNRLSCLHAIVAAILIGCGSDFGGIAGADSGKSSLDAGGGGTGGGNVADSAVQTDAAASQDSSATPDGSATPDTSTPPDNSTPNDVPTSMDSSTNPPDTSAPDDAVSTDGPRSGDATADGDVRLDALVSRDATSDVSDARSSDVSADGGGGADGRDGGADVTLDTAPDRPSGPTCGDGKKEGTEECDDGNRDDFDGCSSLCTDRRACLCCLADEGDPALRACKDLEGEADSGPKIGTKKAQLCQDLYTCLLKSRCGGTSDILLECYCGAGNVPSPPSTCTADPTGPCVAEFEAGMEADGDTWQERIPAIINRLYDNTYGGGQAGKWWQSERTSCPLDCATPPQWAACVKPPDPPDGGDTSDAGDSSDAADASSEASD